jgi:site-specific DNA-methyltransferase (adenine-specific)
MEGMKEFPDKYFELAIVDPPYGIEKQISVGGKSNTKSCVKFHQLYSENFKKWDIAPTEEYFNELFRVSKNQIIWGGNYFNLPRCRCFIFWDKCVDVPNFSAGEYAWTSFDKPASKVVIRNTVEIQRAQREGDRFHPTQKPVKLYEWILTKYATKGDKILDTHVGSASSLIACHNLGFDYVGFEIDKDYYSMANKRLNAAKAQVSIFDFIER